MNIDKSADEVDMATDLGMAFVEEAQLAVVYKLRPESDPNFNGSSCVDCGEPLIDLRKQMFRVRCVECQTAVETKGKYFARN